MEKDDASRKSVKKVRKRFQHTKFFVFLFCIFQATVTLYVYGLYKKEKEKVVLEKEIEVDIAEVREELEQGKQYPYVNIETKSGRKYRATKVEEKEKISLGTVYVRTRRGNLYEIEENN